MNCKKLALWPLVVALMIAIPGYGQFRNWDRFELGGNFIMATGNFSGVSTLTDGSGKYIGDTSVKRSISTSVGYGLFLGSCIPFKRLGHESLWAISIGFQANELIWSDVNSVYSGSNGLSPNTTPNVGTINAMTMQFALPFGIEYKVGTDAIKSQRSRTGASFGIGLMPVMNGTTIVGINSYDEHTSGFNYGFNPYFKAEAAFYAGLCIKLRFTASYGKLNYLYENTNIGKFTDGPIRITGLMNLAGTLIIMPFSARWTEHSWYNTYDTYNPFDKLH